MLRLASASPRRKALLEAAGVNLEVCPAGCDERVLAGEDTLTYVRRIAADKLRAARSAAPVVGSEPWLAADTVVWFSPAGAPMVKPSDRDDARRMVRTLTAGAPHDVTTAWAMAWGGAPLHVEHATTRVWMRALDDDELEAYLAGDEWADKAGGYGIQSTAMSWVTRIEGSYTNVVGLPVAQVLEQLRRGAT